MTMNALRVRTRLTAILAMAAFSWPAVALACPVCGVDNGGSTLKVVVGFMTVPFIVALVVLRAARRVANEP
jgi:hypothetical protein